MIELLLISAATASVCVTITQMDICAWLRQLAERYKWSGKLFNCPFCLSFWVSLIFMFTSFNGEHWLLSWFAAVTLSSLFMTGIVYFFLLLNTLEE